MAIHIDVLARIRERQVQREADKMADQFDRTGAEASERFGTAFERGMGRQSPKIQRQLNAVADATANVRKEQYAYDRMVAAGSSDREALGIQADRIAIARRREADAHRSAGAAIRQYTDAARGAKRSMNDLDIGISSLNVGFINFGKSTAALATSLLPGLIVAAVDTGKAVLTASQSIALIPAIAAAAGAGMGTLALATSGFGDAIKDIRDADKFAEDLALLSPNAQQAALSIRNLLPEFDKLRMATSDAFFAGIGEQIHTLANQYLPTIQNLTTSIAGSFNQMMMNVGNQLMTPEAQAQIGNIFGNIQQAFTNLVPAANSFTQALLDITSAGSDFLPELATDIANAAANFAAFIREARNSGELRVWIQEGVDAVKALAGAVFDIGKAIYQVFGEDGRKNVQDFISTSKETIGVMVDLMKALNAVADFFRGDSGLGKLVNDAFADIPEAAAAAANGAIAAMNYLKDGILNGPIKAVNALLRGLNSIAKSKVMQFLMPGIAADLPQIPEIPDIPNVPSGGDWSGYNYQQGGLNFGGGRPGPSGAPGAGEPAGNGIVGSNGQIYTPVDKGTPGAVPIPGKNQWGIPGAGTSRSSIDRQRSIPAEALPNAGLGPYGGPFAVPAPPEKDASGHKLSDKERRDQIIAGLDPSLWKVDPFAPVPGAEGLFPGGLTPGGMPIAGNTQETLEAQHRVMSEAHDLEEARKARLALEKDNTATQHEIDEAKWKELEAGWALQKAQADLAEKSRGTTRDLKEGMDQLGAALDPDFGLSKGLAGLAENVTKMIGNMIAAPFLTQMQGIVNANKAATGIEGGYGLMGIRGAQNMAMGLSPILGNPVPGGYNLGGQNYSLSGYANAYGMTGAYPGDAALLANVRPGHYSQDPGRDLLKGLSDCSSSIGDLVTLLDTGSTAGPNLTTGNAAQWLTERGFLPGMGGPGDFRVGYNAGHMQATLPGGTPWNWGSEPAAQRGGIGGTGADDPAFTSHYYRPSGASAPMIPYSPPAQTSQQSSPPAQRSAAGNWFPQGGGVPGLYSPENTNPGLTNPLPPPGTPGFGGGEGMPFGNLPLQPNIGPGPLQPGSPGGSVLSPLTPGTGPTGPSGWGNPNAGQTTTYGGNYGTPGVAGGGGVGITPGGTIDTAMSLAGSALDVLAPGAGQAAQTGIKLANRAIQYAGQLAGIGVQGLMETFLPTGGSDLANNSWLTRLAGAAAGAIPAIPNVAGGKGGKDGQQPLTPEQAQQYLQSQGQQTNVTNNVEYNNIGATEDRAGADLTHHLTKGYQGPGPG